jgi:hypothetical protein
MEKKDKYMITDKIMGGRLSHVVTNRQKRIGERSGLCEKSPRIQRGSSRQQPKSYPRHVFPPRRTFLPYCKQRKQTDKNMSGNLAEAKLQSGVLTYNTTLYQVYFLF